MIVKSKIENIWQADAVHAPCLQIWQSLNHDGHFCQHPNGIQRDEQRVPTLQKSNGLARVIKFCSNSQAQPACMMLLTGMPSMRESVEHQLHSGTSVDVQWHNSNYCCMSVQIYTWPQLVVTAGTVSECAHRSQVSQSGHLLSKLAAYHGYRTTCVTQHTCCCHQSVLCRALLIARWLCCKCNIAYWHLVVQLICR